MAPPMADMLVSPLVFHGVKLAGTMKNGPTMARNSNGTNFSTRRHDLERPRRCAGR